jgi:hypothetical protein
MMNECQVVINCIKGQRFFRPQPGCPQNRKTFLQCNDLVMIFLPYNKGMPAREQYALLREDVLLLVSLHNVLLLQALQGVGSIPAIFVLQITKQKFILLNQYYQYSEPSSRYLG